MSAVSSATSLVLLLSFTLIGPSSGLLAASQSTSTPSDSSQKNMKASLQNDPEFLKTVEIGLLNIFGLKNRPKAPKELEIPEYMMDLYRQHVKSAGTARRFPEGHKKGLTQSNTVRSFFHKELDTSDHDCDKKTCVRIWFNVSNIPDVETLAAAELRLFKDVYSVLDAESVNPGALNSPSYRVEVHEIMQRPREGSECISRLIDTKVVNSENSSWETFDVHSAVLKWRARPQLNHGLEVRLVANNINVDTESHVRLRRSVSLPEQHWQTERPLLVTYTDDGRDGHKSRTRRSSGRRKKKNRKKKRRQRKRKNQCRRHALYVDFNDVGWNDWIVAPSGYNAFYCHGDCPFPLNHYLNSTNHAIVQTLVNSVNPSAVPKACCVPTELTPISMLYLDEWGKVVLKNYQDMVVESCGCR